MSEQSESDMRTLRYFEYQVVTRQEKTKELVEFAKNKSPVFYIISHPTTTAVKVSLQD